MEFDNFELTQDDLSYLDSLELQITNDNDDKRPCTHVNMVLPYLPGSETDPECRRKNLSSDRESEDDCLQPVRNRKRRRILSESESEDEIILPSPHGSTLSSGNWYPPTGDQPIIIFFTETPGLKPYSLRHSLSSAGPSNFYSLMVPEAIFERITKETNIYANQVISKNTMKRASRMTKWTDTNKSKLKNFFGLVIYMGLVKLPKLSDYWANDDMFGQLYAKKIMSRNRFELILRMLHFSNNTQDPGNDRLYKIRSLIDELNVNFTAHFTPDIFLCVDESMIPFRGRIIFRQYLKQKRHKYGIKIFKLCTVPGYMCKLEVYAGKHCDTANTTPTQVVMSLCRHLFNKGHILYTDNWYTSIDLAEKLLQEEMHFVGTLRKNRKKLPKDVTNAKLKPGQYTAAENDKGITVMKWRDKREVSLLSTKHTTKFVTTTNKRGQSKRKPEIVVDYNRAKSAVDLSDQMTAYSSPLRKTVKWYRKLACELLLNTALVNALVLYKQTTKKNISVVQFRKAIVNYLMISDEENEILDVASRRPRRLKHELKTKEGKVRTTRRWCQGCYKLNVQNMGRNNAKNKTKKVATFCSDCPSQPHYCLTCFNREHRY